MINLYGRVFYYCICNYWANLRYVLSRKGFNAIKVRFYSDFGTK